MDLSLSRFVDIHCHLLPACDDGPANLDGSLAMVRCYAEAGIREAIATPHHIPGSAWSAPAEAIMEKITLLQQAVDAQHLDLKIHPGMEIALHRNMDTGLDTGRFLPLAASNSYLLEPDFHSMGDEIFGAIDLFRARGREVILAHPERVRIFQEYPGRLVELVRQGKLLVQVNIGSLLGNFGAASRETALKLARENAIGYLASDAHAAERRRPPSGAQWEKLCEIVGKETIRSCTGNADQLVRANVQTTTR